MTGDVLLQARNVSKAFATGGILSRHLHRVRAVDDVSLELPAGETLGVVGESGCGKSTLARMLVGLEQPDSGQVLFRGSVITGRRERRDFRRHVQMVFQDPYTSLNPRLTVADIIGEPLDVHRLAPAREARRRRVGELLELVGLDPSHARRFPHEFSGGQRQRIGIARALALEPEVLVCDEPVSALDVSVQAQVIKLLRRLQEELGLAIMFIAHDLSVVRNLSHRVAVMYLGRVVESGPAAVTYDHPAHPYTRALLSAVPSPDPRRARQDRRIRLQGEPPSAEDPPSGCTFHPRCWLATDRCREEVPSLEMVGSSARWSACHYADDVIQTGQETRVDA